MAMIGTTTPSSARCRRSRITTSSISSSEPESTITRPAVHRLAPVRAAVGREFDGLAAFEQENLPRNRSDLLGERGVAEKLPVFAVHRNEILGPHELQQDFHFFLARVAGNVNRRRAPAFVVDQNAPAEEMIDHPEDRFLVSGNDSRGQYDGVVFGDAEQPVIVHRDPR